MRRMLVALVLVLTACGGGNDKAASPTTVDETRAAYCRLMERTDPVFQGDDFSAQVPAERERIDNAPSELLDEYAYWDDEEPGIPNEVIARVQDWTQEHCGFLPSF